MELKQGETGVVGKVGGLLIVLNGIETCCLKHSCRWLGKLLIVLNGIETFGTTLTDVLQFLLIVLNGIETGYQGPCPWHPQKPFNRTKWN